MEPQAWPIVSPGDRSVGFCIPARGWRSDIRHHQGSGIKNGWHFLQ